MGFRFWRRLKIAPGVTLNLGKSGGSLSFGPRGAKFTVGSRGKRATVGIPGTGLFYTTTLPSWRSGGRKNMSSVAPALPSVRAEDRLTLGFFKRLVTPDDEEALVDGWELVLGNEDKALQHLKQAGSSGRRSVPRWLPGAQEGAAGRSCELPFHGRRKVPPPGLLFLKVRHLRHHEPPHHRRGVRARGSGSAGRFLALCAVGTRFPSNGPSAC